MRLNYCERIRYLKYHKSRDRHRLKYQVKVRYESTSLIGIGSIDGVIGASIIEALDDFLVQKITESEDLYYYEEVQMLKMLFNIFGEKETIDMIYDGSIFEVLDETSDTEYGKNAIEALDLYSTIKFEEGAKANDTILATQQVFLMSAKKLEIEKEKIEEFFIYDIDEDKEFLESIIE